MQMNIELKKLELLNFKGIKEKTIEFGKETNIF
jgi:predicted ATP-dependent endonuclease of OLD family